jgi:thiamine-phosphate pyrophosphorylase
MVNDLVFSLYLLTSGPEGVQEAIEGGVDLVQFRDKTSPDPVLLEKIHTLMDITRSLGVPLIINDRPDLCVRTDASGVHLGQDDMPVAEARQIVGPDRAIGVSTRSLEQAVRADEEGADYIAIGPAFPTDSKGVPVEAIGMGVLRDVVASVRAPVVAIGGITRNNVEQVLATKVRRIAVIGGILGGGDPRKNAEALKAKIACPPSSRYPREARCLRARRPWQQLPLLRHRPLWRAPLLGGGGLVHGAG